MSKLYVVIPAYNEQANIEKAIKQWYPIVEKIGIESRLVIVDDGSSDHTYEIMKSLAKERPQYIPLSKKNEGHGATVLFAYQYALKEGNLGQTDYIFQTDSDNQTVPEEFWMFWEQREHYAMVIGHRKKRKDGISRVFVTKILKLVIRVCFGVCVKDANTPFRLLNAQILKDNIKDIPPNFNLSNVLISVIYTKKQLPICYIPITFKVREGGINSLNLKKIVPIGLSALKDFKQINSALFR